MFAFTLFAAVGKHLLPKARQACRDNLTRLSSVFLFHEQRLWAWCWSGTRPRCRCWLGGWFWTGCPLAMASSNIKGIDAPTFIRATGIAEGAGRDVLKGFPAVRTQLQ